MGIDLFDIQHRIERRFGIEVCNDELAFFEFVGTLEDFVWQKLQGTQPAIRMWQYHLTGLHRRIVAAIRALPGYRWRLSGRLEKLIPTGNRGDCWAELGRQLGVDLPPLEQRDEDGAPQIPRHLKYVSSLTYALLRDYPNHGVFVRGESQQSPPLSSTQWTRQASIEAIREILVDVLRVKPHEVVRTAHLCRDLGAS